jgi:hypothetical protein
MSKRERKMYKTAKTMLEIARREEAKHILALARKNGLVS